MYGEENIPEEIVQKKLATREKSEFNSVQLNSNNSLLLPECVCVCVCVRVCVCASVCDPFGEMTLPPFRSAAPQCADSGMAWHGMAWRRSEGNIKILHCTVHPNRYQYLNTNIVLQLASLTHSLTRQWFLIPLPSPLPLLSHPYQLPLGACWGQGGIMGHQFLYPSLYPRGNRCQFSILLN